MQPTMNKGSHVNYEIIIAILLFSDVCSERKQDYGTFTACVNTNQGLTLRCLYPRCESDQTPFKCNLYDAEGDRRTLISSSVHSEECRHIINDHTTIYHNMTKIYICILSRSIVREERTITVNYANKKERPRKCKSGGQYTRVSGLLYTIAFLFFQETYL